MAGSGDATRGYNEMAPKPQRPRQASRGHIRQGRALAFLRVLCNSLEVIAPIVSALSSFLRMKPRQDCAPRNENLGLGNNKRLFCFVAKETETQERCGEIHFKQFVAILLDFPLKQ